MTSKLKDICLLISVSKRTLPVQCNIVALAFAAFHNELLNLFTTTNERSGDQFRPASQIFTCFSLNLNCKQRIVERIE